MLCLLQVTDTVDLEYALALAAENLEIWWHNSSNFVLLKNCLGYSRFFMFHVKFRINLSVSTQRILGFD